PRLGAAARRPASDTASSPRRGATLLSQCPHSTTRPAMRQGFPQAYPSSDIVPNSGRLFAFVLAASALAACSSGSSGGGSGGGGSGGGGGGGGGGTPSFAVSTSAGTGGSISPPNASVSQGSTTSFSIAALPSHD